jgi:methionyl-tRNA formyltransferase
MGTPDFAVPPLEALLARGDDVAAVVCQPDRPQGRHMALAAPPVKQLAVKAGIPVLQPEKLRDGTFEMALRAFSPDLVVTAAYGRILPPALLLSRRTAASPSPPRCLPAYRARPRSSDHRPG